MKRKLPEKFLPRLIMTVFGVIICAIAVGFFKNSLFGIDPFQSFAQGSHERLFSGVTYGTYYMVISIIMFIVVLVLDKHYIGIATILNLFFSGYIVDYSIKFIAEGMPNPNLAVRVVMLAVGVVVLCFASSLYMTSDLGVSVYDAIPIIISKRTGRPFKFMRIGCDLICVIIGVLCGLMPGIGTLVTAFFMEPLIDFFNRKFSKPLLDKFKA